MELHPPVPCLRWRGLIVHPLMSPRDSQNPSRPVRTEPLLGSVVGPSGPVGCRSRTVQEHSTRAECIRGCTSTCVSRTREVSPSRIPIATPTEVECVRPVGPVDPVPTPCRVGRSPGVHSGVGRVRLESRVPSRRVFLRVWVREDGPFRGPE